MRLSILVICALAVFAADGHPNLGGGFLEKLLNKVLALVTKILVLLTGPINKETKKELVVTLAQLSKQYTSTCESVEDDVKCKIDTYIKKLAQSDKNDLIVIKSAFKNKKKECEIPKRLIAEKEKIVKNNYDPCSKEALLDITKSKSDLQRINAEVSVSISGMTEHDRSKLNSVVKENLDLSAKLGGKCEKAKNNYEHRLKECINNLIERNSILALADQYKVCFKQDKLQLF